MHSALFFNLTPLYAPLREGPYIQSDSVVKGLAIMAMMAIMSLQFPSSGGVQACKGAQIRRKISVFPHDWSP